VYLNESFRLLPGEKTSSENELYLRWKLRKDGFVIDKHNYRCLLRIAEATRETALKNETDHFLITAKSELLPDCGEGLVAAYQYGLSRAALEYYAQVRQDIPAFLLSGYAFELLETSKAGRRMFIQLMSWLFRLRIVASSLHRAQLTRAIDYVS